MLDPTFEAVAETHEEGEIEVKLRLKRIVAFGFRERLAGECHGILRAGLAPSQLCENGRPFTTWRCPGACRLEQRRRTVDVPGDIDASPLRRAGADAPHPNTKQA